ncbi:phage terminase large subunit family protein [Xenorhabdus anantnagensis]|uniref:Phage terminase large subunit family protein n=1 Tax=Xenorhabdus anantnagensis TaxID=3025875 RepID=A0ABT5LWB4_9GAMM|nr:phage terminase large subunit family protein [Xenorhabdus anantnagensis]MDC9598740.1 phage terminase large subunit family protein [Xenorhabdus anantnagensis]
MITVHTGQRGGNAWQNFTRALVQKRADVRPPEPLSLSEWANKYAVLSKENSAQTGKFRSFGYQDGMMDAITDPGVTQVSVMKSARVGYTKILDHVVGYYLSHDPSPILVVQPRVEDAEDYSKTEIAPMLRDTPVLKEIAGEAKAKDSGQTILKKQFSNGANLTLVGANSPGGFRRITCRIILFDEVDGYPSGGAGAEGDQIALGIKRSETFWNRKIVLGSTPTVKETSRIEKAFKDSDQRYYYVPCPHCGEFQVLEWGGPDTPYGMKWEKDEHGNGLPETAYYVCRHNGCVIHDSDKPLMIKGGEWRAEKPFTGHAGFHIWAGYSLFPNAAWPNLVKEWLRVKSDPLMRQTFINLVLGEPYEDRGEKALSERKLLERCEVWAAEVPDGVAVLTAGIDTQDGRFEIEVVGWGCNEESWSIAHDVIEGDLETDEPWRRLDAYLKQIWRRADGYGFTIMAACMDSGGHHTQRVYDFARERLGRRIWAIKGESARGGARSPIWPTKRPTPRSKSSFKPIILGVNAAKDAIRARLHIEPPEAGEPAPAYMHFPVDRDLNYFSQLLAERSVIKITGGQRYRVWEQIPGRANEALDCRVYSYAALCGLLYLGLKLNVLAGAIDANPSRLKPPPVEPEAKISLQYPGVVIQEPDKPQTRKPISQMLP